MDRRAFVTRAPLGLLAASLGALAQPSQRVYRIGVLSSTPPRTDAEFRQDTWATALRDLGWIEGRSVVFERRYANRRPELLPGLARELVAAKVDVIATFFGNDDLAAKQATSTIPIVTIYNGYDAVEDGLIASYARPGGNVTGVSRQLGESDAKRLELIREVVPRIRRAGIVTPSAGLLGNPEQRARFEARIRAAASGVQVEPEFLRYGSQEEVEAAFPAMERMGIEAFLLDPQPFTFQNRRRIAELAVKHRLPGVFTLREYAEAGGLLSYGPVWKDLLRQHARYVDRILRGAPPADLPVEQPTRFELLVNLKTAAALALKLPQSLLARADERIE